MADIPARATCDVCGIEQRVTKQGRLRKHKAGASGADRSLSCTGSGTLIGPARIPRRSTAGYYRCHVTGEYLRSVTTVLSKGSPKEALVHWAAKLSAESAMEHLPELVRASRSADRAAELTKWIARAHTRKRDERADLGTAVHEVIEAKVLGTPIPDEITSSEEMAPFIAAFEEFVADWQVEFTASEMVVANYSESYAGTLDYMFRSAPLSRLWSLPAETEYMGDTKTGGELDERTYDGHVRGVYPEAGVQLSAYRRGEFCWLRDGTRVPMPLAHSVGVVLQVRPEGYRLYPMRCGDDVFKAFCHIRHVADFHTDTAPHVVGDALTPPGSTNATRNEAA
ncbi:hypothetical protein F4561_006595 [Lipingzhangella halophila]|uniref:Uncharacterized protein n=1 Tax=Lipingzhangella halophila TaxID=1783352 RepID=A0A7W7W6F1_9ACTN|nr:hypothetical protein [Lipingzhangella halophila]MBB4935686.1 hypothetical protein [Lipingzhangella halophila]